MLRFSVIDFGGSWNKHLHLAEFSYNNNYPSSIKMTFFFLSYVRLKMQNSSYQKKKMQNSICWDDIGKKRLTGPKFTQQSKGKVGLLRECLKEHKIVTKVTKTLKGARWNLVCGIIYS